jgi:selenocysteine lyase/cysteine desulfurase
MDEGCRLQGYDPDAEIDCCGYPIEQTYAIRVSTALFNTDAHLKKLFAALQKAMSGVRIPVAFR